MKRYARLNEFGEVFEVIPFPDDIYVDHENFYPPESGLKLIPLSDDDAEVVKQSMVYNPDSQKFEVRRQEPQVLMNEALRVSQSHQQDGIIYKGERVSTSTESLANMVSLISLLDKKQIGEPVLFSAESGVLTLTKGELEELHLKSVQNHQKVLIHQRDTLDGINRGKFKTSMDVHNFLTHLARTAKPDDQSSINS